MAKENQETVGEVDELPVDDSGLEGAVQESEADHVHSESDAAELAGAGEVLEDSSEGSVEPEDYPVVSAPPSLAMWLADELRPSPSKSIPPVAAASVNTPETLAPVAVPPTELSDEDLAVLPPGSRPGASRSGLRAGILLLLGAAAAVFLFSYARSPATGPEPHTQAAAQPVAANANDPSTGLAPARATDVAPPTATTADEPSARRTGHGHWVPPAVEDETALDEEARLRGPSVGRFPDLPAEYWSELRRRDLESRAERQRQLATETLEP